MTDLIISRVMNHEKADEYLIARVNRLLAKKFPGYIWEVFLNEDKTGGILQIINVDISNQLLGDSYWAYVLRLSTVYSDPNLDCVVKAGRALLESAGLPVYNKFDIIKCIDGVDHKKHPLIGMSYA